MRSFTEPSHGNVIAGLQPEEPLPAAWPDDTFRVRFGDGEMPRLQHRGQQALLDQVQGLKTGADVRTIHLSRRQHDAPDELAETLAAIHQRGPSALPESLDERYRKAVQSAVRLRFDHHPEMAAVFGPLIDEWVAARRLLGDKEWLREARQGLEKGVPRPHGWEMRNEARGPRREVLVARAIQMAIRAQYTAGAQRVRWAGILTQLTEHGLVPPQSLENFTKWVSRHLISRLQKNPTLDAGSGREFV